ncbi:MAG: sulfonate ABC transporter substrate-binding protein, partial [Bacillus sp. (in: firmicutes)]
SKENPKVLDVIYKELEKTDKWVEENPKEAAKFLAPEIGMSVDTLELTLNRRTFGLEKMSEHTAKDQQQIADAFYKLKLIPENIEVQEALLKTNN